MTIIEANDGPGMEPEVALSDEAAKRAPDRAGDFEEFVLGRSPALLRTGSW